MPYVIRADDNGRISWVTPPNDRGFPALSDRGNAAVFPEHADAQAEFAKLASAFARIGVQLSIEAAD